MDCKDFVITLLFRVTWSLSKIPNEGRRDDSTKCPLRRMALEKQEVKTS